MDHQQPLNIVILGLSLTSSWGNGHATTYRGLVLELNKAGHKVLFLERDQPWYAGNRDLPAPSYCETGIYQSLEELKREYKSDVKQADLVIVGSYVPDGIEVGEWVVKTATGITAFYDIDTPVTLAKLEQNECDYLNPPLISEYDLYLSFTGGSTLKYLEEEFHSPAARPLYCSVDPSLYFPGDQEKKWDLGYLGTYSEDRQPPLEELLLKPAKTWSEGHFVAAGPMYPDSVNWPENVERYEHLGPEKHRWFYNSQRFTLNITRKDMIRRGYSPSVRLFEAAACETPIISDYWEGLDSFFEPGKDLLISRSAEDTLRYITSMAEAERIEMGESARRKVLQNHTAAHRAKELTGYLEEVKILQT
ncbi:MAG: glycosyltransferase [Balneolaceae bacterium]